MALLFLCSGLLLPCSALFAFPAQCSKAIDPLGQNLCPDRPLCGVGKPIAANSVGDFAEFFPVSRLETASPGTVYSTKQASSNYEDLLQHKGIPTYSNETGN